MKKPILLSLFLLIIITSCKHHDVAELDTKAKNNEANSFELKYLLDNSSFETQMAVYGFDIKDTGKISDIIQKDKPTNIETQFIESHIKLYATYVGSKSSGLFKVILNIAGNDIIFQNKKAIDNIESNTPVLPSNTMLYDVNGNKLSYKTDIEKIYLQIDYNGYQLNKDLFKQVYGN